MREQKMVGSHWLRNRKLYFYATIILDIYYLFRLLPTFIARNYWNVKYLLKVLFNIWIISGVRDVKPKYPN